MAALENTEIPTNIFTSKSIYDDDETDITFRITNRSECSDEILNILKTNMQREIFCYHFLLLLVEFYLALTLILAIDETQDIKQIYIDYYKNPITDTLNEEFKGFIQLIETVKHSKEFLRIKEIS